MRPTIMSMLVLILMVLGGPGAAPVATAPTTQDPEDLLTAQAEEASLADKEREPGTIVGLIYNEITHWMAGCDPAVRSVAMHLLAQRKDNLAKLVYCVGQWCGPEPVTQWDRRRMETRGQLIARIDLLDRQLAMLKSERICGQSLGRQRTEYDVMKSIMVSEATRTYNESAPATLRKQVV